MPLDERVEEKPPCKGLLQKPEERGITPPQGGSDSL